MKIVGRLVDVHERRIYPAVIHFGNGKITSVENTNESPENYILPGLIDAHIHIESSMITPGAFAQAAVKQGTTGVVSDPHEIANVLGIEGVDFMINDARKVPLNFWFGAPSCVPATEFETSGGSIDHTDIKELMSRKEIKYLAEMMNFPGVVFKNKEVWKKIKIAHRLKKPIDGHAPGLSGEILKKYIAAGITTDHECSSLAEAKEKITLGMKVLIREGSAARNLDALKDLINTSPEMVMLCSDDLHPEMLVKRHINKLVSRLVSEGFDLFNVIRSCTVNPVQHYGLDAGLLMTGQQADFIIVNDYKEMNVLETWISGVKVFDRGAVLFDYSRGDAINKFNCSEIKTDEIKVKRDGERMNIIEAFDGELLTRKIIAEKNNNRLVEPDTQKDILKIVVKDRYNNASPAIGFIKGFGLRQGAFASSVAHDSHNIICVGTNDEDIVCAINEIVQMKGGLSVSLDGKPASLKLNIAGIMSDSSCDEIAAAYEAITERVRSLGCHLKAPYMTLSFMALLVIPELKIGDKGLFDVTQFRPISLFVD
jgi:adenine deaminase